MRTRLRPLAAGGVLVLASVLVGRMVVNVEALPVLLAVLMAAILAAPIVVSLVRGTFQLLEPLNVVFLFLALQFPVQMFYVAFVLHYDNPRVLAIVSRDHWVHLLTLAMVAATIGALAFLGGYYLQMPLVRLLSRVRRPILHVPSRPPLALIAVLAITGLVAYIRFMDEVGGASYFISHLSQRTALAQGHFYLLATFQLLNLGVFIWYATRNHGRETWQHIALFWLLAISAVVLTATLGGRGRALYVVEIIVILRHVLVRRLTFRTLALLVVMSFAFLAAMGAYRQSTVTHEGSSESFSLRASLSPDAATHQVLQYDYSPLDMTTLLIDRVGNDVPMLWGSSFAHVAILPIPRSWWPSKPRPISTWYNQVLFGAERTGKRGSIIAEAYTNWLYPGVFIVMWIYGIICRVIWERFKSGPRTVLNVLVFALLYKFCWQLSGGSFSEVAQQLLIYLIPLWLVMRFMRTRQSTTGVVAGSDSAERSIAPTAL
jgi:hypothetical protein